MKKLKLFDSKKEFIEPTQEEYDKNRLDYIASFEEYHPGGFLTTGEYIKNPQAGEAQWNSKYPKGFEDWSSKAGMGLTRFGQRELIRKHDELVETVNKLVDIIEKKK